MQVHRHLLVRPDGAGLVDDSGHRWCCLSIGRRAVKKSGFYFETGHFGCSSDRFWRVSLVPACPEPLLHICSLAETSTHHRRDQSVCLSDGEITLLMDLVRAGVLEKRILMMVEPQIDAGPVRPGRQTRVRHPRVSCLSSVRITKIISIG